MWGRSGNKQRHSRGLHGVPKGVAGVGQSPPDHSFERHSAPSTRPISGCRQFRRTDPTSALTEAFIIPLPGMGTCPSRGKDLWRFPSRRRESTQSWYARSRFRYQHPSTFSGDRGSRGNSSTVPRVGRAAGTVPAAVVLAVTSDKSGVASSPCKRKSWVPCWWR